MDTSHDFARAQPLGPDGGLPRIGSSAAADAALVDELLASPDYPRDLLRSALVESRRQFRSLLSSVSGTFFRCDLTPPYALEFPDPDADTISGYDLKSFTDNGVFTKLIHPEDLEPHRKVITQAIKSGTPFDVQYRLRHRDGRYRWVRSQGKAVYDASGTPQFIEGFVSDITEKKELALAAEEARSNAQALNTRLGNILEGTLDSVLSIDSDLKLTYANEKAIREIRENGYPEWDGATLVLDKLRKSPFWDTISLAMKEGKPKRTEAFSTVTSLWFDVHVVPDGNGGIILFYRDISDRKSLVLETESARQEATVLNEKLSALLESTLDCVISWDRDWNVTFVNGRAKEEIRRQGHANWEGNLQDLLSPKDTEWWEALNRAVETGESVHVEAYFSSLSTWYEVYAVPDDDGLTVFHRNISDRKEAELTAETARQETKELNDKLSHMLESTLDCVMSYDRDWNLTFANGRAMEEVRRNGVEDWTGNLKKLISGEDDAVRDVMRRAMENGEPGRIETFSSVACEWYDIYAVPDGDGITIFHRNISDRKQLEHVEAEHAQKLHLMLESTLDCVLSYDRDWNLTYANGKAKDELGRFGIESWSGEFLFQSLANDPAVADVLKRAMDHDEPGSIEVFSRTASEWYNIYATPDGDGITIFHRNITGRKQLEEEKARQAENLKVTLDSIPDMVWTTDADGMGQYFNRAVEDFTGITREDFLRADHVPDKDLVHPEDRRQAVRRWKQALAKGEGYQAELRMRYHTGDYRWVLSRAWPQKNEAGEIVKWYGSATDINDRVQTDRKLRESEILQGSLMDSTPDYILVTDLEGTIQTINNPSPLVDGSLSPNALIGQKWGDLWPAKGRRAMRRAIRKACAGESARFNGLGPTPEGKEKWWDSIVSPIRDDDGEIRRLLCIIRDISDIKANETRLRIASERDFLTGLPNRRVLKRHLKRAITKARDRGSAVGLMLLDLDHFKHVNDAHGHLAGDHLLRVISKRLTACVSRTGFVARLGGDEFAIVLSGITDEMELVSAATQVLAKLEAPVTYKGKPLASGMSIGCAMYPRDAMDANGLLKHADMSLYDLKASGRGGVQMFNAELKEAVERTATQLTAARKVIHDDTVEPFYQPKVRLEDGSLTGFEALLRWWCPGNGIQLPGTVSEAFNDYELSTKIGGLMQSRVFSDIAGWLESGLQVPSVSINASPAEFLRDDYAERLLKRVAEFGFEPSLVEVEITEHVFLERRSKQVIRGLQMLKDSGIRVALDDFGTGHSSLSYLRDFPVDVLKLDRSFVKNMLNNDSIMAIVQAIVRLGPSIGLEVVAEGVETPEQYKVLRDSGCDIGQGYLFGRAVDAEAAESWLKMGKWPLKRSANRQGAECRKVA